MSDPSGPSVKLSIVIPVFDEEACIQETLTELVDALDSDIIDSSEIVCVDDGSSDRSVEMIRKAMDVHPQIQLVRLSQNYGQTAAFDAGFRSAGGIFIGMMDADGQNDPHDFPRMLRVLVDQDLDMVCGIREHRHDGMIRRISSRIANGFRNWATGEHVTDVGCSIRVFRSKCIRDIKLFDGMHRFFPTLFRMEGCRISEMPVNHRSRSGGQSKYGIRNRLWRGLRDVFAVRWMQSRSLHYEIRKN
jgi:dolichol-phosphate mannosyltransferase